MRVRISNIKYMQNQAEVLKILLLLQFTMGEFHTILITEPVVVYLCTSVSLCWMCIDYYSPP